MSNTIPSPPENNQDTHDHSPTQVEASDASGNAAPTDSGLNVKVESLPPPFEEVLSQPALTGVEAGVTQATSAKRKAVARKEAPGASQRRQKTVIRPNIPFSKDRQAMLAKQLGWEGLKEDSRKDLASTALEMIEDDELIRIIQRWKSGKQST